MVVNDYSLSTELIDSLVQSVPEKSTEISELETDRSEVTRNISSNCDVAEIRAEIPNIRSDITVIPLCSRLPKCEPRDGNERKSGDKAKHSTLTISPVTGTLTKTDKMDGLVPKTRGCTEFTLSPAVTIETVVNSESVGSKMQNNNRNDVSNAGVNSNGDSLEQNIGKAVNMCSDSGQSSCLYDKLNNSFSSSCTKSYSVPLTPMAQSKPLVPVNQCNQNGAYCGFNSFTSSPLSSPKYGKPINALNSCRMSSSPVPAYMRSKEPSYSAPLLCNIISDPFPSMMPPDSPSFKPPSWNGPNRGANSNSAFNFPLPPTPPINSSAFSQYNQSNSLIIPMNHHGQQKSQNYGNTCRAGFSPYSPNGFQRAQCCFSSQIQCFNGGCNGGSQQQFSFVQHSTRLSNLKTNSLDSVSSLLQYHYFKKY